MRVRPFFWLLLCISCLSVVTAACIYHPHTPAILYVHINTDQLAFTHMASLELQLTDPQGLPIDEANVIPSAHMTNMRMYAHQTSVTAHGRGKYSVHVLLSMAGPWSITVQAHAPGFDLQEHTQLIQVT